MKKRLISLLLCLVLCIGLLPMAALAGDMEPLTVDSSEAEQISGAAEDAAEPTATPDPTAEPTATPEPTAEPTPTPEPEQTMNLDGESDTSAGEIARVQALLDSLPDADSITAENRADVEAQLTAIDDAKLLLTDEEREALDFGRYNAAIAALEALDNTPGASEPALLGNKDYQDLQKMIDDTPPYKTVYLEKDYTIDQTLVIKEEIILNFGFHTLTGIMDGPVVELSSGAEICYGKITNTKTNTQSGTAAGVLVTGHAYITNITIKNCETTAANSAGGVYVASSGNLTMNSEDITNCSSTGECSAGGVYIASGAEASLGGFIHDCWTSGNSGAGGVYVAGRLYGYAEGTEIAIYNCDSGAGAANSAGGIYLATNGTVDGKLDISNCKCKNGGSAAGIYVAGGTRSLNVNISGCKGYFQSDSTNKTLGGAAAIYIASGNVTMSGTISRCVYESNKDCSNPVSGGVYVASGATFTMNSGSKIEYCRVECPYSAAPAQVAGGVYNDGSFTTSGKVLSCNIWFLNGQTLSPENRVSAGVMNCGTLTMQSGAGMTNSAAVPMTVNNDTYTLITAQTQTLDLVNGYKTTGGYKDCKVTPNGGTVDYLFNCGTISTTTSTSPTKFTSGTNYGTIQAADFYSSDGTLDNYGTITGGTYKCTVTCHNSYTTISGGTFTGKVYNTGGGVVSGGDFSGVTARTWISKITFDLGGGTGEAPTQWRYQATATKPTTDPTRDDYIFIGWYQRTDQGLSEQSFDFGNTNASIYANDIALVAKWTQILAAAPTANSQIWPEEQTEWALVTGGTLSSYATENSYTLQYRLGTGGTWSTTIPTASEAGTYTVYYRVVDSSGVEVYTPSNPVTVKLPAKPDVIMTDYTYCAANMSTPKLSGDSRYKATFYYNTSESTSGSKTWTDPRQLDAGTYYMYAVIDQGDDLPDVTTDFVSFTVSKATPTITEKPVINRTVYTSDPLSDSDLTGGKAKWDSATVEGTFTITGTKSWTTGGQQTTTVKFDPTNTSNYESATFSIDVPVTLRTATAPTLTPMTAAYTGDPIRYELEELPTGVQSAAYSYRKTGETDFSSDAPTDAGSYDVKVTYTMQTGYDQLPPQTTTLTVTPPNVIAENSDKGADDSNSKNGKAVKTGDEATPALWLALCLSAALALGYTARKKEK